MSNLLLNKNHPTKTDLEARREAILSLLKKTTTMLKKFGINHVCCSGTALGLLRDGNIIYGDSDFDVVIKYEDINTELIEWGIGTGRFDRPNNIRDKENFWFAPNIDLAVDRIYGTNPFKPFNLKVHSKKRVSRQLIFGDIFILYEPEKHFTKHKNLFPKDCYIYTYNIRPNNIKFFAIPKSFIDSDPYKLNVDGFEFNLPANPISYLISRYGSNWKTPKAENTVGFKGDGSFNPFISMSKEVYNEIKVNKFLDIK